MNELRRRLAAILHADVVGYSRMMEQAETRTLRELQRVRREVWEPAIRRHFGRVVGTAGDAMLIEFASALAAVACAVDLQRGTMARAAAVEEAMRLRLRIGVNLGDVVVEEDGDLYGEGVNLAQRLESLAEADGIMVSPKVREEVGSKLGGVDFEDAGEHKVKNIRRPIHAWRVVFAPQASRKVAEAAPAAPLRWRLVGKAPEPVEHVLDGRLLGSPDGLVIGRHSRYCALVLGDDSISRRHARLTVGGERATIEDLGSTNGTFVEGKRLTAFAVTPIRVGNRLRFGEVELVLRKERTKSI